MTIYCIENGRNFTFQKHGGNVDVLGEFDKSEEKSLTEILKDYYFEGSVSQLEGYSKNS